MRKNYWYGFLKNPCGVGIMLTLDPPYAATRVKWVVEVRLIWFKAWYVKPYRRKFQR